MPIRRCVCGERTFEELKALGVHSLEDAARYGCGIRCGLCRPYLLRMIETGRTAFAVDETA